MAFVKLDDGENVEHAIKRFKRVVEREGIIRSFRDRVYYEKPSVILNRKKKAIARKQLKKVTKVQSAKKYWLKKALLKEPFLLTT